MAQTRRGQYLQALNQMRNNYLNSGAFISPSDDTTAVGNEVPSYVASQMQLPQTTATNNDTAQPQTKSTENAFSRTVKTTDEFISNVSEGIFNFFDDIGDFFIGTAAKIGSAFGANTQWAEDAINYDWVAQATALTNNVLPGSWLSGDIFNAENWTNVGSAEKSREAINQLHTDSWVSQASKGFQEGYNNITTGLGNMLPSFALALATGGTSTIAQQAALQGGLDFITSTGGATEQALQEGNPFDNAYNYAATKGTVNALITAATVGIGASVLSRGNTGVSATAGRKFSELIFSKTKSKGAQVLASKTMELMLNAGFDGMQAAAEVAYDPLLRQITLDSQAIEKAYGSNEAVKQTLNEMGASFATGALLSAIYGSASELATLAESSPSGYMADYYLDQADLVQRRIANEVNVWNKEVARGDSSRADYHRQRIKQMIDINNDYINTAVDYANTARKSAELNERINTNRNIDNEYRKIIAPNETTTTNTDNTVNTTNTETNTLVKKELPSEQDNISNIKKARTTTEENISNIETETTKRKVVDAELSDEKVSSSVKAILDTDNKIPASLIKDSSDLRKKAVLTKKDTDYIIKKTIKDIQSNFSNTKIKLNTSVDDLVTKTFRDINTYIAKADGDIAPINRLVNELGDAEVNLRLLTNGKVSAEDSITTRLRDIIGEEGLNKYKNFISSLVKNYSKPSKMAQIQKRYTELREYWKSVSSDAVNRLRDNITINKNINTLKNIFDKNKNISLSGKEEIPQINFYRDLIKGIRLSKTAEGVSPKSIDNLINNFKNYTLENYSDISLPFNSTLRDLVDSFAASLDSSGKFPNRALTHEESNRFIGILQAIRHDIAYVQTKEFNRRQDMIKTTNLQAKTIADGIKPNRSNNIIRNAYDSTYSFPSLVKSIFGENSDVYNHFFNDYIEVRNNEYKVKQDFINEIAGVFDNANIKLSKVRKELDKKVKVGNLELTVGNLLSMKYRYDTLTAQNSQDALTAGFKYRDTKSGRNFDIKLSEDGYKTLFSKIPEDILKVSDDIVNNVLNKSAKAYFSNKIKELNGISVDIMGYYYPLKRMGDNNTGLADLSAGAQGFLTAMDQSFTKSRTGAKRTAIEVGNFLDDVFNYTDSLSYWGEMAKYVNDTRILLNTRPEGDDTYNLNHYMGKIVPNWNNWSNYLTKILTEAPIRKNNALSRVFNNTAFARLGANVGTVFRQFLSAFAYSYDPSVTTGVWTKSFVKGFADLLPNRQKKIIDFLSEESPYLAQRFNTNAATKADFGNAGSGGNSIASRFINGVINITGKPMEITDRLVITTLGWEISSDLARREGYTGVDAKKRAVKILEKLVLTTQSNAEPMFMSRLRAGDVGEISRALFGIFQSDNQLKLEAFRSVFNEFSNARKNIKSLENVLATDKTLSSEQRTSLENQIAKNKTFYSRSNQVKRVSKVLASVVAGAIGTVLISELTDRIKGKKEWDESVISNENLTDVLIEASIGWMPYIGQIANAFRYNSDLSFITLDSFNELKDSFSKITKIVDDPSNIQNWVGVSKDIVFSALQLFGIPVDNLYNYSMGIWKNISPETAMNLDNYINMYSSSYIKKNYNENIEKGNINSATSALSSYLYLYSLPQNEGTLKDLTRLSSLGYDALPKAALSSYTNEKGEVVKLTTEQKNGFMNAYKKATAQVNKLRSSSEYKNMNDENKAKSLKAIFDAYYDYAKAKVVGGNSIPSSRVGKVLYATDGSIDELATYLAYAKTFANEQATATMTKKEKVISEINKIKGLSKDEKLFILYLIGYSLSDDNQFSIENILLKNGASQSKIDLIFS